MSIDFPPQFYAERHNGISRLIEWLIANRLVFLFGKEKNGVDIGCGPGTSCGILEKHGCSITYLEPNKQYFVTAVAKWPVVNTDAESYMAQLKRTDFITFFGAPCTFPVTELVTAAIPKLSMDGFLLITGYPNLEPNLITAQQHHGGIILHPPLTHNWDSVAYLYSLRP